MNVHLQALRDAMAEHKIDAYLIPTADFHGSEYVGAHFACRDYVSGFTGSAGTLLVFPNWAGLWTDGRYFLQAQQQLQGSDIRLMKQGMPGVPSLVQFLQSSLQAEQVFGFDGRCVSARDGRAYHAMAKRMGARLNDQVDLVDEIWFDRPPRSAEPAWLLEPEWAGETRASKLARLRARLQADGTDVFLLTALEDIGWLLNLRGGDIPSIPVVLAYLSVTATTCELFAEPRSLSPEVRAALAQDGVLLRPYDSVYSYANRLSKNQQVQVDFHRINTRILTSIPTGVRVVNLPNPTEEMKAVKNETEIENMRRAHEADGLALTRFMYWLKTGKETVTERSAAAYLESLRKECPAYLQPSFDPILAFGAHSAIIHYSATEETDSVIEPHGFLLADTGGHYRTGTTDCTRTYAMGELTDEQKRHYTTVLRGNLNLGAAVFRAGCTGVNLDYAARLPLWEQGLDFNHGTGHGVGYLLSVHEGPQAIRRQSANGQDPAFLPGMITSNEPGVYFDGQYGVRLENLILCKEKEKTDFGEFLCFETLTLTPFDLDAVDASLLTERERARFNAYHERVRAALTPKLTKEEADWLKTATRPI